jgi:hypothetical protein
LRPEGLPPLQRHASMHLISAPIHELHERWLHSPVSSTRRTERANLTRALESGCTGHDSHGGLASTGPAPVTFSRMWS